MTNVTLKKVNEGIWRFCLLPFLFLIVLTFVTQTSEPRNFSHSHDSVSVPPPCLQDRPLCAPKAEFLLAQLFPFSSWRQLLEGGWVGSWRSSSSTWLVLIVETVLFLLFVSHSGLKKWKCVCWVGWKGSRWARLEEWDWMHHSCHLLSWEIHSFLFCGLSHQLPSYISHIFWLQVTGTNLTSLK